MIKTAAGPIGVNTVEEDLTYFQQLTGLGQLQGVDIQSFPSILDGALIPAVTSTHSLYEKEAISLAKQV